MKKLLAILALLVSTSVFAQSSCDEMFPFGEPTVNNEIKTTDLCRLSYFVKYDNNKKVPVYSAELLLKEHFGGSNKRINAFKADPDLPKEIRAELSDYDKTYDRGHMTPFEDAKWNSAASLQTFYLSNMVPQDLHLNRGLWRSLENRTRTYATDNSKVYVNTGPVWVGKYSTIGNGVGKPPYLYKVLIDKEKLQGVGYLIPNTGPKAGVTLKTYIVPISDIEKATGTNFTPKLLNAEFKNVIGKDFQ